MSNIWDNSHVHLRGKGQVWVLNVDKINPECAWLTAEWSSSSPVNRWGHWPCNSHLSTPELSCTPAALPSHCDLCFLKERRPAGGSTNSCIYYDFPCRECKALSSYHVNVILSVGYKTNVANGTISCVKACCYFPAVEKTCWTCGTSWYVKYLQVNTTNSTTLLNEFTCSGAHNVCACVKMQLKQLIWAVCDSHSPTWHNHSTRCEQLFIDLWHLRGEGWVTLKGRAWHWRQPDGRPIGSFGTVWLFSIVPVPPALTADGVIMLSCRKNDKWWAQTW